MTDCASWRFSFLSHGGGDKLLAMFTYGEHSPSPRAHPPIVPPQTQLQRPRTAASRGGFVQRKCACDSESATPCAQCATALPPGAFVQRAPSTEGAAPQAGGEIAGLVNHAIQSGGQSLDPDLRSFFEPRFGRDFSGVRVHTGAPAAESAKALTASAFTVGENIVFGAGRFQPASTEGKRLLAHELTHVVQQGRGGVAPTSEGAASALETDADAAASSVLSGADSVAVNGAAPGGLQMDAEAYVWNPHVDGYGHAAIKLCDGTYISWWPTTSAGSATSKEQYWSGRPGGGNTYADDIGPGGEGKGPDVTYNLGCDCLDEKGIRDWYSKNFTSSPDPKWSVLRNSCSDVAHQALNVGSNFTNPCYLSLSHSNFFWTPKDFGAYASCQSRWCASKKAGALNATGRYIWENVKEAVGGGALNTLRSLWWKGEIVFH